MQVYSCRRARAGLNLGSRAPPQIHASPTYNTRSHLEMLAYDRAAHLPGRHTSRLEADEVEVEPIGELAPMLAAVNAAPETQQRAPTAHTRRARDAASHVLRCCRAERRGVRAACRAAGRRGTRAHARRRSPPNRCASLRPAMLSTRPIEPRSTSEAAGGSRTMIHASPRDCGRGVGPAGRRQGRPRGRSQRQFTAYEMERGVQ